MKPKESAPLSERDEALSLKTEGGRIVHETPTPREQPSEETGLAVKRILSKAAVKKPIPGTDCPWLTIAGRAGTLEYAENVYDWMESEFGHGHFCICADEGWWYVEERAPQGGATCKGLESTFEATKIALQSVRVLYPHINPPTGEKTRLELLRKIDTALYAIGAWLPGPCLECRRRNAEHEEWCSIGRKWKIGL